MDDTIRSVSKKEATKMLDERTIVDTVERTHSDRPYCECGRANIIVYRAGAMWLECDVTNEPLGGRVARLWSAVTDAGHVHHRIVEVPPPEFQAA